MSHAGHSSEDYSRKIRNLATYENAPSSLFENIYDRFV